MDRLVERVRACTVCERAVPPLPHAARPVLLGTERARIRIIGQAPGTRVHASGRPFTDPSGDRLRDWLGVDEAQFYDPDLFAITPMGFCFPGLDAKGSDLPPRRECGPLWQSKLSTALPNIELCLMIGMYAQAHYLGGLREKTLTETVRNWRAIGAAEPFGTGVEVLPLPHPSWRNTAWLARNPWFSEVLEHLHTRVGTIMATQ